MRQLLEELIELPNNYSHEMVLYLRKTLIIRHRKTKKRI